MKIEEIEEQAEHQACAHIGISSYKRNPDAHSLFKNGFRVGAEWMQKRLMCCGNCKHEHCYGVCVSPEKCVDMNKWEMKE